MKFKLTHAFIALFMVIALVSQAGAASIEKLSLNTIVEQSKDILSGKVINVENRMVNENGKNIPYTYVTVAVNEDIKGNLTGDTYTFRCRGGRVPEKNLVYKIGGMPEFTEGQEVFLFLDSSGANYSPIIGFYQGRFNLKVNKSTGIKQVYDNDGNPVSDFSVTGKASASKAPMNYETFKTKVKGLLK